MNLEDLVADGWRRHAEEPQQVASALADSVGFVAHEAQSQAFSRLLTHLYSEHLDDWSTGVKVLEALRERFEGGAPSGYRVASTGIGTLRFIGGDADALTNLSHVERASALATSASALAWHDRLAAAVAAFQRAVEEAGAGIPDGSPALRALATGGNNLAVALERKVGRDEREDTAMVQIADAALVYWKRAGGWLEVERAQYRCARSRLQAGRPFDALECAQACLQTCEQNTAPSFEFFFAYALVAVAHRAAGQIAAFERYRALAEEYYRALSPEERTACEDELGELGSNGEAIVGR